MNYVATVHHHSLVCEKCATWEKLPMDGKKYEDTVPRSICSICGIHLSKRAILAREKREGDALTPEEDFNLTYRAWCD